MFCRKIVWKVQNEKGNSGQGAQNYNDQDVNEKRDEAKTLIR